MGDIRQRVKLLTHPMNYRTPARDSDVITVSADGGRRVGIGSLCEKIGRGR